MDDTSPLTAIMREIAVMKKVDHPHVVRLHEVIDPPGASHLMMVMEYCEGGCAMETRAQTGLTPLGEDTAREYFRQVGGPRARAGDDRLRIGSSAVQSIAAQLSQDEGGRGRLAGGSRERKYGSGGESWTHRLACWVR